MTFLAVLFMVLTAGVLLVAYGTAVKNRWGINLDPVCCPRCKTSLPKVRTPQSFREAMWGGCTCPACGVGVDKWGREVAPTAPRTVIRPIGEIRRAVKKRAITIAAIGGFWLELIFYWSGFGESKRWIPSNWKEALVQIGFAVLKASFWTLLFAIVFSYVIDHFFFSEDPASKQGHDSDGAS